MNLSKSPGHYSHSDQENLRAELARADQQNVKRNSDIEMGRARLFMNSSDGVRWSIVVDDSGDVYATSSLTSAAIADNGVKSVSAAWVVEPGYRFVLVDCTAADVTITYEADNATLRERCRFRKTAGSHNMIINDGTNPTFHTEPSNNTIAYERTKSGSTWLLTRI